MKRIFFFTMFLISIYISANAQKVFTKNGSIYFTSTAALENITAANNQVMSVLNTQNGELIFSMLIKGFHFKKSLMEEHFNEDYLESDKYPKAAFKGHIADPNKINYSKDGNYMVNVNGEMAIHGVSKEIAVAGTLSVRSGTISTTAKFSILLSDYNIAIPDMVKDKIAETIDINITCVYEQKIE